MADTNISWTDKVWNPLVGCSIVSPGCSNCYAMAMANRLERMGMPRYQGTTKVINGNAVWTGKVNFVEEALEKPLHWKKPARIFVNSMSDLLHEAVPDEWIDQVFAVMALCPHLTFQMLTKRAERLPRYFAGRDWSDTANAITDRYIRRLDSPLYLAGEIVPPLPNVHIGVSVENQAAADARIPWLLKTPTAVRFLSIEPLLGQIDIDRLLMKYCPVCHFVSHHPHCPMCHEDRLPGISWVIVGGESGVGYRPMDVSWLDGIVQQCDAAQVKVFTKQDSGPRPGQQGRIPDHLWIHEFPHQADPNDHGSKDKECL